MGLYNEERCPMAEAGYAGPCDRCWQDPEGFEECLERAADFESLLNPAQVDLEDMDDLGGTNVGSL
jgi:hypothetical protein